MLARRLFTVILFIFLYYTRPGVEASSCCCCFGTGRPIKVAPIGEQNFSVLFNEEHIVKCIDINNNVLVKNLESVRKFMILVTAYNIVQYLNFIGYYLPLTHSRNVRQFQEIMDYFVQFSEGVDRVNIQQAIIEFDEIRERTLSLWYE